MKSRLIIVALLVAVVGLSGCPDKKGKSSENEILTFKVDGVDWQVDHVNGKITKIYPKTPPQGGATEGTWAGLPSTWPNATAVITPKDSKAVITPDPGTPQNFESGTTKFTVTAEDGTPKIYTVQGEKGPLNP